MCFWQHFQVHQIIIIKTLKLSHFCRPSFLFFLIPRGPITPKTVQSLPRIKLDLHNWMINLYTNFISLYTTSTKKINLNCWRTDWPTGLTGMSSIYVCFKDSYYFLFIKTIIIGIFYHHPPKKTTTTKINKINK